MRGRLVWRQMASVTKGVRVWGAVDLEHAYVVTTALLGRFNVRKRHLLSGVHSDVGTASSLEDAKRLVDDLRR